jgi:hypothetical protein
VRKKKADKVQYKLQIKTKVYKIKNSREEKKKEERNKYLKV